MPEQAGPRALAATPDQREQLRLFAADISLPLERAGPLVDVLSAASRTRPELAALLASIHDQRLENLRTLVVALAAGGPLRLEPEAPLETVWALAGPDLYELLTRTRGWTRERYHVWLADSLTLLLLGDR